MNIDFEKNGGLVPAIVQDDATGDVLMLGYMSEQAYDRTKATGKATFWSRSRKTLWEKGETSGNTLPVVSIRPDCDGDALLVTVRPAGPVCHTGDRSCFGPESSARANTLRELEAIIHDRKLNPSEGSRTSKLFGRGPLRIAQKVGEEAVETILAASVHDRPATIREAADLLYHLSVLFAAEGIAWEDVEAELRSRLPAGTAPSV